MLTQEQLKNYFNYDPLIGVFTYKTQIRRNDKTIGDSAGSIEDGYVRIKINKKLYRAHRLVWLYVFNINLGSDVCIDHINNVRSDNRLSNLRLCTRAENRQNLKESTNESGYLGVSWHKHSKKYQAKVRLNNKDYHAGYFDNPLDAYNSFLLKKRELHPFNTL